MTDEEGSVKEEAPAAVGKEEDAVIGSAAMRPIFLANLVPNFSPDGVTELFEKPPMEDTAGFEVDKVEVKRGYCFVMIKDAKKQADKERIEAFVKKINGMYVQ